MGEKTAWERLMEKKKELMEIAREVAKELPAKMKEKGEIEAEIKRIHEEAKAKVEPLEAKLKKIDEFLRAIPAAAVPEELRPPKPAKPVKGWKVTCAKFVNGLGVGATFMPKDMKKATGLTSGYTGTILAEWKAKKYLSQPGGLKTPYRVEKRIPVE